MDTVARPGGLRQDVGGGAGLRTPLLCSRAFLEYYQEHLEYACPTEDIYLE